MPHGGFFYSRSVNPRKKVYCNGKQAFLPLSLYRSRDITVMSRINEPRFNVESRFKVQNLVTKMEFHVKKSRFSIKSGFKESKGAEGGRSLNLDFIVLYTTNFLGVIKSQRQRKKGKKSCVFSCKRKNGKQFPFIVSDRNRSLLFYLQ